MYGITQTFALKKNVQIRRKTGHAESGAHVKLCPPVVLQYLLNTDDPYSASNRDTLPPPHTHKLRLPQDSLQLYWGPVTKPKMEDMFFLHQ